MRRLSRKQLRVIDKWIEDNKDEVHIGFNIQYCDKFDIYDKLKELNDFEILHQEINRYISDKALDL